MSRPVVCVAAAVLIAAGCSDRGYPVTEPDGTLPTAEQPNFTTTTTPDVATASVGIGETHTVATGGTTLELTVLEFVDGVEVLSSFGFKEHGVGALLQVRNVGDADYSVLVNDPLVGVEGPAYEDWFLATTTLAPKLRHVTIRPGDGRVGWVSFDVPTTPEVTAIRFTAPEGEIVSWSVDEGSPAEPSIDVLPGDVTIGETFTASSPVTFNDPDVALEGEVARFVDPATPADGVEVPDGFRLVAAFAEMRSLAGLAETPWDAATLITADGSVHEEAHLDDYAIDEGEPFERVYFEEGMTEAGMLVFAIPDDAEPVKLLIFAQDDPNVPQRWAEVALD